MKTLRVQDEIHEKLTTLVGELTAQRRKLMTYADALTRLLETSIILPDDLVESITTTIKSPKVIGYTTVTDYVRDAVRRRLEEIKGEEFYVNVPIPRESYDLLRKAIEEAGSPFRNADDYIMHHVREKIDEYQQYLSDKNQK